MQTYARNDFTAPSSSQTPSLIPGEAPSQAPGQTPPEPRPRLRAVLAIAPALLVAGAATAGDACGPFDVVPFLLEGDAAAGTDAAYETFDRPNMGEGGHVGFAGDLDSSFSTDDVVVVDGTIVAREGDLVPGLGGARFGAFEFFETAHQVNASGQIAFVTAMQDVPPDSNRAVFRGTELILREGEPLPGLPSRIVEDFDFVALLDDGRVGALVDLTGETDNDSVIWLGGEVLYQEGDAVPGMPGVTFDQDFDELQWNGAGDLVVEANTSMALSIDQVIFRRRTVDGSVVEDVVAQEGDSITTPQGTFTLELILQLAIAENGMWAIRANLDGAPSTNDAIIFTESGFLAQQGDAAAGILGAVLGNFNGMDVDSAGSVLYLADLDGTGVPPDVDEGLFLDGCLVITDGVAAPGVPGRPLLTDIGFEDGMLNDAGNVVFAASYSGGDGLFRFDVGGIPCPGDLDGDGMVGFLDLTTVLANVGPCDDGEPCPADVTGDGLVDFADILAVLSAWGPCP